MFKMIVSDGDDDYDEINENQIFPFIDFATTTNYYC